MRTLGEVRRLRPSCKTQKLRNVPAIHHHSPMTRASRTQPLRNGPPFTTIHIGSAQRHGRQCNGDCSRLLVKVARRLRNWVYCTVTIRDDIRAWLIERAGNAYCSDCITDSMNLFDLGYVRDATRYLARNNTNRFHRFQGICFRCGRARLVIRADKEED